MSLATKYRPTTFNEVIGQDVTIKILKKQLEKQQYSNCYLFCGPSGCGKTTIARIFADQVNKGQGKAIEIDGASNNGVDNIRSIVAEANNRSLVSEYKIYIIDECHMITTAGWNAFLKCIEEPPKYTMFIFCTTDPQKLPDTIKNRMMRFSLAKVPSNLIRDRLISVCMQESFTNYQDSVDFISKSCNGCVREALSYLDKVSNLASNLNINDTMKILGTSDYSLLFDLINGIIDHNANAILNVVEYVYQTTGDLRMFTDKLAQFTLDLTKYTVFKNTDCLSYIPCSTEEKIKYATGISQNQEDNVKYFNSLLTKLYDIRATIRNDEDSRLALETLLLGLLNENL